MYPKIFNYRQQERSRQLVRQENAKLRHKILKARLEEIRRQEEDERKAEQAKELEKFLRAQFL